MRNLRFSTLASAAVVAAVLPACATLQSLTRIVQPPTFTSADGERNEIRLVAPTRTSPLGGAEVRIWTTVRNPNPFGFTLSSLDTTLFLEGQQAAAGEFPLGLPLEPHGESTIPIDLVVRFQDVPALANVIRQRQQRDALEYRIEGTVGVEAGALGTPTFGPMTLVTGDLRAPF
jgi:hypothetical protein